MAAQKLAIFGSAEIASLAHFYFRHDSNYEVVAFTVDDDYVEGDSFENLPLLGFSEFQKRFPPREIALHVALSYTRLNRLREEKYLAAKAAGYELPSYVCSRSVTWPDLSVGDNCFILENQTIQPTVTIGNNVMIWSGNHLGHGTAVKDHVYIASHVCISGHCVIGERTFMGVNATTADFTTVGADCFIAMDASVTRDVPDGAVVLGSPATVMPADDRRGQSIKRKYFKL
jgi:sugar O-acyltransferase (sialic acid O-acetyltransferase NeuD family)